MSQRILETLTRARAQIEKLQSRQDQRIAIVGMAGRFPGAESLADFWKLLIHGQSGIRNLTEEELLTANVPREEFEQENYVRSYASFENPTRFDADFFGYSPGEAATLDPQHRVFLECAWTALEDAGYDSQQFAGRIGVYAGAALNSYLVNLYNDATTRESVNQVQAVVSNVMGLMPTRVSYHLNLTGPSCGVQTGCSTSLVAVHNACRSLLDKDCEMALAGGVTIGQATPVGYLYEEGSIASPDGRCRAFDAEGRGTLFGNGVGVIVLKRFEQAISDGDNIYAMILGSAVNNDGADKVGLLAPSVSGQAAVIRAAVERSGISPDAISYVEAHGTATELGDPVEFAALDQALGKSLKEAGKQCAIGSVKSNVGHLDAAAGITGLIKTALSLKHRRLLPSLNYTTPNPQMELETKPFFVNSQLTNWGGEYPRRAGVSSFGMGGTNAHVIMEEPPIPVSPAARSMTEEWKLLPLSAKSKAALAVQKQQLIDGWSTGFCLQTKQPKQGEAIPDLACVADVAYTLQVGRQAMPYRDAIVCRSEAEAIASLNDETDSTYVDEQPSVIFTFSGQGSQYAGMASNFCNKNARFRETISQCWKMGAGRESAPDVDNLTAILQQDLTATANAQPVLFAVEYALADLLMSWGVDPIALIGHSLGEYVAACLAGVFSLEDAIQLVQYRGEVMQRCPVGSMLAVMCDESILRSVLPNALDIAVKNSSNQIVVSGPTPAIDSFEQTLKVHQIASQKLQTSHAFHSRMMDAALDPFRTYFSKIQLHPPTRGVISNRTGTWLTAEQATDPEYWVNHLRHTVQFADGLDTLAGLANPIFLEIGPGRTLCRFVASQLGSDAKSIQSLTGPFDQKPDSHLMVCAVAELWKRGVKLNWMEYNRSWTDLPSSTSDNTPASQPLRRRIPLPTYPFERKSYYVPLNKESTSPSLRSDRVQSESDAYEPSPTRSASRDWFYVPTWRSSPVQAVTDAVRTIVFGHSSHFGAIQAGLPNSKVTFVEAADSWNETKMGFQIDPTAKQDYAHLLRRLQATENPFRLLHLWTLQSDESSLGFDSLVAMSQCLLDEKMTTTFQLDVVTNGLFSITGHEQLRPGTGVLPGLLNVLQQEVRCLRCNIVDVAETQIFTSKPESQEIEQGRVNERIKHVLQPSQDRIVAYRGHRRWVQTYEPFPLDTSESPLLRSNAVYLIVGDFVDGLGMVYAKALRDRLSAKLILVAPSRLPGVDKWDTWLATHGNQHPISQLIQHVKGLGREGDDFVFSTCNVESASSLSSAINESLVRLHAEGLQGIFYADVMGGEASCSLADLDLAERHRILTHKTVTVNALFESLRCNVDVPEFVALQSSLSSILGGQGFAAYAAANSYLDALAAAQELPCPVVSINWDACELDEQAEDGKSQNRPSTSKLMNDALTPSDVWEATTRILADLREPQVIVSPQALHSRLIEETDPTNDPDNTDNCPVVEPPTRSTDYVAPRTPVEAAVATAMGELLGIRKIGIHDDFFALGGHSLLAIQAITKLRKKFQVDVPMRVILQGTPTVAGIAKVIEENMSSLSEEDAAVVENLLDQIEGKFA